MKIKDEVRVYHARNTVCEMVCGYGKNNKDVVKATIKEAFRLFPDYYMHTINCTYEDDLEQCTIIMFQ